MNNNNIEVVRIEYTNEDHCEEHFLELTTTEYLTFDGTDLVQTDFDVKQSDIDEDEYNDNNGVEILRLYVTNDDGEGVDIYESFTSEEIQNIRSLYNISPSASLKETLYRQWNVPFVERTSFVKLEHVMNTHNSVPDCE